MAETGVVVITKVAFRAPAGTTTLGGTRTEDRFDAKVIVVSTAVTPLSVIVPVDCDPPVTVVGFRAMELNAGEFTVSVPEVLTTLL